jgi:hypothetical protein
MRTPANSQGVSLLGDDLIVPQDFVFPKICLVTGAAADSEPVKYGLTQDPNVIPLGPLALFAWIIVAFETESVIHLYLNRTVRSRRLNFRIAAIAAVPLSFGLAALLAPRLGPVAWVVGIGMSVISAGVFTLLRSQILSVQKLPDYRLRLSGVRESVRMEIYLSAPPPVPRVSA